MPEIHCRKPESGIRLRLWKNGVFCLLAQDSVFLSSFSVSAATTPTVCLYLPLPPYGQRNIAAVQVAGGVFRQTSPAYRAHRRIRGRAAIVCAASRRLNGERGGRK
ncbi:hypothetical protein [Kingella potus]|uniref:hypothetical protein n=1 Tax=Kingella potus TaxID=265175 RepID=UPI00155A0168